ncbi:hypothetical protein FACS1894105_01850 [Clostridia bacterium]|nr:hypothetical protein FACS1894105_01850 [Clostridia bacterium]
MKNKRSFIPSPAVYKRAIALILVVMMTLALVPMSVFAVPNDEKTLIYNEKDLQDAIYDSHEDKTDDDVILIGGDIDITYPLIVYADITFKSATGSNVTLLRKADGSNVPRHIIVYGTATLTFENVILDGGADNSDVDIDVDYDDDFLEDYSGGIWFQVPGGLVGAVIINCKSYEGTVETNSDLTITNCTIKDNFAAKNGGGIFVGRTTDVNGQFHTDLDTTLVVTNSTITNNMAYGSVGGGIYVAKGDVTITGSTITGNTTLNDGGGIYADNANVDITNSNISGNTVDGEENNVIAEVGDITIISPTEALQKLIDAAAVGGTITIPESFTLDTALTVNKSLTFKSATGVPVTLTSANGLRHIVVESDATLTFENITLDGASNGGGIHSLANLTVNGAKIINSTNEYGGGIFVENGYAIEPRNLIINDSVISGNTATFHFGGGIYVEKGDITVNNTTISNNTAKAGGGGATTAEGNIIVTDSTISENTASYGGGLYAPYGHANVSYSTIINNKAIGGAGADTGEEGLGGGVFVGNGKLTVQYSTVYGNTQLDGNALYAFYGKDATVIKDNTTETPEEPKELTQTEALQAAIFAAEVGGTITIPESFTLDTALIVNKSLTFTGSDVTLTSADGERHIIVTSEDPSATVALTFVGVILDGGFDNSKIDIEEDYDFDVYSGGILFKYPGKLIGAIIQNCRTELGAVETGYSLTVTDSNIIGNLATEPSGGGGIVAPKTIVSGGTVHPLIIVDHSDIKDNMSYFSTGGGINVFSGDLEIKNGSEISHNTSYNGGGGVFVGTGTITVTDSEISDNRTESTGGGIGLGQFLAPDMSVPGIIVTNSTITGNSAEDGGGISISDLSKLTVDEASIFSGNTAQSYADSISDADLALHASKILTSTSSAPVNAENRTLFNNYDVNYYSSDNKSVYTVTFVDDGVEVAEVTVLPNFFGDNFPEVDARDGQTLKWVVGDDEFTTDSLIEGNVTVYAQWDEIVVPDPEPTLEKNRLVVVSQNGFVSNNTWFSKQIGKTIAGQSIYQTTASQQISLTATPNFGSGYVFDHWEIEGIAENQATKFYNNISFKMPSDGSGVKVTAVFTKPVSYEVKITSANGTVFGLPFGNKVLAGTPVTLTATPNFGHVFKSWIVDESVEYTTGWGGNSISFTMPSDDVTVTAVFEAVKYYTVTASSSNANFGNVSYYVPFGTVLAGTEVTFTANAKNGYKLDKWTVNGADADSAAVNGNVLKLAVNSNVTVKAVFVAIPPVTPTWPPVYTPVNPFAPTPFYSYYYPGYIYNWGNYGWGWYR